jgi:hypothetical protein
VDVRNAVGTMAKSFVSGMEVILPQLGRFARWLATNKPIMIAAIVAIGAAIALAFGPVSLAVVAIAGLITLIGRFRDDWRSVARGLIDITETVATSFFELRTKVITAFVEMVEEGLNFFLGKMSEGLNKLAGVSAFGREPFGFLKDLNLGVDLGDVAKLLTAPDQGVVAGIEKAFDKLRDQLREGTLSLIEGSDVARFHRIREALDRARAEIDLNALAATDFSGALTGLEQASAVAAAAVRDVLTLEEEIAGERKRITDQFFQDQIAAAPPSGRPRC